MMRKLLVVLLGFWAAVASAQQPPVATVVDDAKAIDRVAEASRRDLPADLLKRILNEDLEALRGHRADDTYQYATYERMEASRSSETFSIQPTEEGKFTSSEVKGSFLYRVVLELPSRRMLVTRNRPVWIERVEIEYMPQNSATARKQSVSVQTWVAPGGAKTVDVDEIARQATVRVFSRADKKNGYGNLQVTLVRARVIDNPDSPYADAVASAKAIVRALDHNDVPSVRAMAQRMRSGLEAKSQPVASSVPAATAQVEVVAPRAEETPAQADSSQTTAELQTIEDLLTGSEAERRQGMDRLHQLLRRMKSR